MTQTDRLRRALAASNAEIARLQGVIDSRPASDAGTRVEWGIANRHQRQSMTWPREVIDLKPKETT